MTEKTGFIVKWSLSDGVILAEEGTEARAPNCKSIYFRPSYPYAPSLVVGKEVFYSKDEAVKAANEMRRPPRQQDREPMTMDDLFRSYGNNSLRGK